MTDTYDITHGVGGLWESWLWNSTLELNTDLDTTSEGIFLTQIPGLHGLPDHEDPRASRVGRIGENVYPTTALGKTLVPSGEIRANTLKTLRLLRTQMVAAFADLTVEGAMDLTPHPDADGPAARFHARPMQLDIDEVIAARRFIRPFTLGLRLADPRFYFPELAVDESGSSSVTVSNPGSAPIDPVVTLTSAAADVVITDGTHTLTFRNVPSGTMIIDFAARTAKVGSTNCELVVGSSDWWDSFVSGLAGGATVTVSQTGASAIQVTFTPADW